MTEVPTQPTPAPAPEVHPGGQPSTPPAAVAPTADRAPSTSNSSAPSETPEAGAGRGVDLDSITDPERLQAAVERLEGMQDIPDDDDLDDDAAPQNPAPAASPSPSPTPAPAPAAAPAATPAPAAIEDALTKPGELPRNFKVPIRDPLDLEVQTLIKQSRLDGKPLSYADAESQAKTKLGLASGAAPASGTPEAAPASTAPAPQKAPTLQEDLDKAYEEYQDARLNFNNEAETAALRRINELERQTTFEASNQANQQQRQAQEAQQSFEAAWTQTLSRTQQIYPEAANPESALSQRAAEIQQAYAESNDPAIRAIYYSPSSALLYFQQAAADLGVAPAASAPAVAAPPQVSKSTPPSAPVTQAPPMASLLAGGNSGGKQAPPGFNAEHIKDSYALDTAIEQMESALLNQ